MTRIISAVLFTALLSLTGCGKGSDVSTSQSGPGSNSNDLKLESFAGFWQITKNTTPGHEQDLAPNDRPYIGFKKAEITYLRPKSARKRSVLRWTYTIKGKSLIDERNEEVYSITPLDPNRLSLAAKIPGTKETETGILERMPEAEFNARLAEFERLSRDD